MADAKYYVQAILDVKSKAGGKAEKFARGLSRSGDSLMTAGNSFIGSMARGAGILAAVGGYALGRLISGAIDANREMENVALATATTFQLFERNKNVYDDAGKKIMGMRTQADQFNMNLVEAKDTIDKLFRIAAVSPASFQQAQQLFANMLPGAAQVETSMEKILELTKNALAGGVLLGGDFAQAGADLRRILTGQAGMDVRAWSEGMSTAISNIAGTMGKDFKKVAGASGDVLTQAFNKLAPEKRYALVQKTLERMGIATEKAGETWDGLTSTIKSDVFLLSKTIGETIFGGMKKRFKKWTSEGGLLDPTGKSFGRLEKAAQMLGYWLGRGGDWLAQNIENGIDYVAQNWEEMIRKGSEMWSRAMKVVKLMLTAKGIAIGAGLGMKAAGAGMGAAQGAFGMGKEGAKLAGGLMPLMRIMALMAPVAIIAGLALGGLAVMFGGVVAWFVEHWDEIIKGINDGTVKLGPLVGALGQMWAQLLALGEAILGTNGAEDATTKMNKVIILVAGVVFDLIGAMGLMLKTLGWVQYGWNLLTAGLRGIYAGFVSVIMGIMYLIREAMAIFPSTVAQVVVLDLAIKGMDDHVKKVFKDIQADKKDATQILDLADAFIEASDKGGEFAKGLEDAAKKAAKAAAEGAGAGDKPKTPGPTTHIHHLEIRQDLRNHDPDRIMGAFIKKLQDVTARPTQAVTQENYGV